MKFRTVVGIDYSGAGHCCAGLSGLRVFCTGAGTSIIQEIRPQASTKAHWSRESLAEWLFQLLADEDRGPTLVGIDHALSFPTEYFALHAVPLDWDEFLAHFCQQWPMDRREFTVKDVFESIKIQFGGPHGSARWRRIAEKKSKGAKSVFHFGVPGAVANSTHAGIPWIRRLRTHPKIAGRVHFWPFDGWIPRSRCSVVAEVYPSLWSKQWEKLHSTQDQHDAFVTAKALLEAQTKGELSRWFNPDEWINVHLTEHERRLALVEGWILGLN